MKTITLVKYAALLLLVTNMCINSFSQTPISPYLIGENAWGPRNIFEVKDQVKLVAYQTIRIGGNGYENGGFIDKDAVNLIDYVRSVGAEPILQMPRQFKDGNKAYNAVEYLNGKLNKHIKYWSIGNEPDHKNQLASAEEVCDYFKKISSQIKSFDSTAVVMGFDLSSYKKSYLDRLLGGDLDLTGKIPGSSNYYLDIVTFHGYRFTNVSKFESEVIDLRGRLAGFNKNRPLSRQLGWAITEFNSHWLVDNMLDSDYLPFNFHNGQLFAEVYDLGMREGAFTICPWSMLEGGAQRHGTDLSLFDKTDSGFLPRSNYYHTQMIANNIKKTYLMHSPNNNDLVVIPMGDETGLAVMILNKNKTQSRAYTLKLNYKPGNDANAISINANLDKTLSATIEPESTTLILVDVMGKVKKVYSYSAADEAVKAAPHIKSVFDTLSKKSK